MPLSRRRLLTRTALAAAALATRAYARPTRAAKPMRLLVLGGTGFIGPHLVRYALERGHKLTLFNRGERRIAWPGKVEELVGDRNAGDLKALAGRDFDACIDIPTTLPMWVRDAGRLLQGHVGHYVYISSISAYASDATPDADESAPVATYRGKDAMAETQATLKADMGNLYGPLKATSEREAQRWFPNATTVIRPGLIAGPGDETDRWTYWPVRLARGGDVLAPGDGNDPVQYIDVRDLAVWAVHVLENRTLGTYNATGPADTLTMRALLEGIRAATSAKANFVWAPTPFLEKHAVAPWSDMPVWLPGQGDTAGFARRSNAKARAAGLTFRPVAQTAVDTLQWFREQAPERQAQLKAGLTPEREAQLLQELAKT